MSQGLDIRASIQELPERIGRYELLIPIGSGGMGSVYLARARGIGGFEREVALKLLRSHNERHALDLVEEAKLTASIRHPNVVQVLDIDEGPLGVFMVLEYIEGSSLSGLLDIAQLRGERVPREIGLRILLDALAGLDAAHDLTGDNGVRLDLVHRDVSPQNILVGTDGRSRLADFGIARVATRGGHTTTGVIKGKVAYMAPEQILCEKLDRRCDVWAAGVVAWQLIAGQPMHRSEEDMGVMYRIVHEPAPRLGARGIDVPIELDEVIARALARELSARYPTAAAFARSIEATGVEVATVEEVADYVRRVIGPKLAERRAQIAQILERRRERARSAAPPLSHATAPGMAPGVLGTAPPRPGLEAPQAEVDAAWQAPAASAPSLTGLMETESALANAPTLPMRTRADTAMANAPTLPVQTVTSPMLAAVTLPAFNPSTPAPQTREGRSRAVGIGMALVIGLLAGVGTWTTLRPRSALVEAAPALPPASAPVEAAPALSPASAPVEAAPSSAAPRSIDAPARVLASASSRAQPAPRSAARPSKGGQTANPTRDTLQSPLASSPYGRRP